MRKKHRLLSFIICILLLSASGVCGYFIAKRQPRIVEKQNETQEALSVGADADSITAQTVVNLYTEYELCAHTTFKSLPAPEDMQGLTLTQFMQRFAKTMVLEFSEDSIVIENTFDCYCPDHYILKKNGSLLSVYRTRAGTGEQYIYYETNVKTYGINEEELDVLRIGKLFSNMQEIDDYVEKITADD